jgi:5-methylcytosine-specific restriction protein A
MSNYRNLSDAKAVLKAIAEYDQLGQEAFLKRYGFGKARSFVLIHGGRHYDSKAIVGAAYGHQFGTPLKPTDFSGGLATVVPLLGGLGFEVVALGINDNTAALAEEVPDSMWEGGKRTVSINAYERSAEARAKCIEAHGSSCAICGFDFGRIYGDKFHGFIHVHHKTPVSQVGAKYKVNPEKDLIPVCPNCHAIIHYGNETRSVDDVRSLFIEKSSKAGRGGAQ